jgi:hypothetical protein
MEIKIAFFGIIGVSIVDAVPKAPGMKLKDAFANFLSQKSKHHIFV